MTGPRPRLSVVEGGRTNDDDVERIALSLVHSRVRIDIPVTAIVLIEAFGEITFANQKSGEQRTVHHPHVEVSFTQEYLDRILRLTKQIVDQP
jgi:hypothetical protein